MSALAYKLAFDLATAPTLRLLAAGRQARGQLLDLALLQHLLEPSAIRRTGFGGAARCHRHQTRRHLRKDMRALGLEAVELVERPVRHLDLDLHGPAECRLPLTPCAEMEVANVHHLAGLQHETRIAGAVELAAIAVVHRLDGAGALAAIGNHMIFARIELDLGYRRLGQRPHIGDGDPLMAPEAIAFPHAEQHRHVDALRARRTHAHDRHGFPRLRQGGSRQVVVNTRRLGAASQQQATRCGSKPTLPVPPSHDASAHAIAKQAKCRTTLLRPTRTAYDIPATDLPRPAGALDQGGPDYALTSALPLGLGGRTSGAVQMDGRFWSLPSACIFFISAHLALICSAVGGTTWGTVISRVFICA